MKFAGDLVGSQNNYSQSMGDSTDKTGIDEREFDRLALRLA